MRLTLPLLAALLVACAEESSPAVDRDEDGIRADDDCDDRRAEVSPDQEEICDGLDNDCDGLIDEDDASDATLWYLDYDRDGYGGTVTLRSCTGPTGWITAGGDCDDGDATIAPGVAWQEPSADCQQDSDGDGWADAAAASPLVAGTDCDDTDAGVAPDQDEICDGVDTDCDGALGEDELDEDADTYLACTLVETRAAVRGDDCDDTDPTVSPGATERCNDGAEVDDDCNGIAGDATGAALDGAPVFYRDADGDGYGAATGAQQACTQPAGYAASADDCDDSRAAVYPGADELCDGLANDCAGTGVPDEGLAVCPSTISGEVSLEATVDGAEDASCTGRLAVAGAVTEWACEHCTFALELSHGAPSWLDDAGNCDEVDGFGTVLLGFVSESGASAYADVGGAHWRRYEDGDWVEAYEGTAGGGLYTWSGSRAVSSSDYTGGPVTYAIDGAGEVE